MPPEHIISRIKSIEGRISEIQKMGQPANSTASKKTEQTKDIKENSKFSDILKEVMDSKAKSQLDLLSDTKKTAEISNISSDSRFNALIDEYKKSGMMPTTEPKTLGNNKYQVKNPDDWNEIIEKAAEKYGLDSKLIHAVIRIESAYNPKAVSIAGAEGLMQLMPNTAKDLGVENSFDPEQNIMGGANYLRQMLDRYEGDLIKSLSAFNAGTVAVDKANGIPPFKETQEYVPKILNYYYNIKQTEE